MDVVGRTIDLGDLSISELIIEKGQSSIGIS